MKTNTALRLLGSVMDWTDEVAQEEFSWMQIMARLKYDDYRDFLAGMRFLESLVAWLQQFEQEDRAAAYNFVRKRLVFVSVAERERLVELLYPRVIWPELVRSAATKAGVRGWQVLTNTAASEHLIRERRATLFLALSDGARLDAFRHANPGRISNEQVVVTVDPSAEKWSDLLKSLRKDLNDTSATFGRIVLVDDFTASGTSLLRTEDGRWKGKLPRFLASVKAEAAVGEGFSLLLHHLIGTPQAEQHLTTQVDAYRKAESEAWSPVTDVKLSYGHRYQSDLKLDATRDASFVNLTDQYYDPGIQTEHTDKGGEPHLGLGYARCALPMVLDHNTPNNSVALLWAESEASKCAGHLMRPLFRRRQRHS